MKEKFKLKIKNDEIIFETECRSQTLVNTFIHALNAINEFDRCYIISYLINDMNNSELDILKTILDEMEN